MWTRTGLESLGSLTEMNTDTSDSYEDSTGNSEEDGSEEKERTGTEDDSAYDSDLAYRTEAPRTPTTALGDSSDSDSDWSGLRRLRDSWARNRPARERARAMQQE